MDPIAKSPMGGSKLGGYGRNYWNNLHRGVDGPLTCEICGTGYLEDNEGYTISRFLGREVVEDCCGAILDMVYKESGEEFAIAFLEEFAENPADPRFFCLLEVLKRILPKAKRKLEETEGKVEKALKSLDAIGRIKR